MTGDPIRRFGYPRRRDRSTPLERATGRLGLRMIPTNRARPADGPSYGACPACGDPWGFWIEPGGAEWSTTCGCTRGRFELIDLALFIAAGR